MASTSSVQKRFKYDVFLSFRGEDTRKTFVDHLYHALNQKGIITYKDDGKIEKGDMIKEQLIRSIEESRLYMIVFSKKYASSSWCLEELVKIMECQKMTEHTAYPIFYDVEPTEVRNQSGVVGEAFAKHVEKDAVGRWRDALKEVASLGGWELKNTFDGHEAKFIQQIVEEASLKLHLFNSSIDEKLVGMETRVKHVVSSLEIDSDDVRMIGIWGMGGSGKTTLARAVFDHISIWFEGKSFVENVREVSKGSLSSPKKLQKQVLRNVLNDQGIIVTSVYDGKHMMKKMMGSRKVLVVLDDVDDIGQLEALVGDAAWFKPGSRIIITTRDEQVLKAHRVNIIHDACLLSYKEAICLFSRCAFGREIPNHGYKELSRKVVHYAAGLPLTIKVLGSFLFDRTQGEWEDTIQRLKTIPLKETLEKLEISYNGLEDDQKEIFLDIACILKGTTKNRTIRILESCGFRAHIGLRVLEQKSLLTITKDKDVASHFYDDFERLLLHDHTVEMGMSIVRRVHPEEPNRHRRLWIKEEIEDILVNELGTESTRSIQLWNSDLHPAIIMKGLKKMKELRFLCVLPGRTWQVDEVNQHLPDALRSLSWHRYPFQSLPTTFQANKLVNLEMFGSKITELWEGGERKVLDKIRFLDLSHSKLRTFDIRMTPHLEELYLSECPDLLKLHMLGEYPKLKLIDLSGSVEVYKLHLGMTPHLEKLNLARCYKLLELHLTVECPNLKFLDLSYSKLRTFDIRMTPHLEKLYLRECPDLLKLHMLGEYPNLKLIDLSGSVEVNKLHLGMTPHLEKLNLARCYKLLELHLTVECPNLKFLDLSYSQVNNLNLRMTPHLEKLELSGCARLQEVHAPMGCLNNLFYLDLCGCSRFEDFLVDKRRQTTSTSILTATTVYECPLHPENNLPTFQLTCVYDETISSWCGNIENLFSSSLCACTKLESFFASICGLQHVRELNLESRSRKVPKDICQLESLEKLSLRMGEIRNLPDDIYMLKHLKSLDLQCCGRLLQLPEDLGRLECLEELNLNNCSYLQDIPKSICNMKCLKRLRLYQCCHLKKLPEELGCLECLEKLDLTDCISLQDIPNTIGKMKCLKQLHLTRCRDVEILPEELGSLECLEELSLTCCTSLRDIPNSICKLKHLKHLDLSYCYRVMKLPEELGCIECLEELSLTDCTSLRDIPNSICKLKCLKRLDLSYCKRVKKLPEELGCLECLEELELTKCKSLQDIPNNICKMTRLKRLALSGCHQVQRLPEEFGCLECLEELDLRGCRSLQDIPNSICKMKSLKRLYLSDCHQVRKLPEELGCLQCLEELDLRGCRSLLDIPNSICKIKCLQNLDLSGCIRVGKLPEELGCLECLKVLDLRECSSLQDIPSSISRMKSLRGLYLCHCIRVEKLPEELGSLECLTLSIDGTAISCLPQSIYQMKGLNLEWSDECFFPDGFF
ncbi:putative TIR domain, P-loop containing nucleoside triphosphate hydrolase [Helianthus debilis subsp. tardiflorus]